MLFSLPLPSNKSPTTNLLLLKASALRQKRGRYIRSTRTDIFYKAFAQGIYTSCATHTGFEQAMNNEMYDLEIWELAPFDGQTRVVVVAHEL